LRTLTRTRRQLVREKVQHVQRIQKAPEDANIKIDSVISDVMGTSGRRILRALIAGERDPEKLVEVTTGRLRASRETLVEALRGYVTKHHRFLLKLHLDQVQAIEQAIASVEEEVGESLKPFRERADLLTTIPGIDATVAHVIVAEIGVNMSRFPTAAHLRSWAGFCPRNDQSAGKRRSNRIRKGAPWLKTVLVQAAWAAVHTKGTYLRAQFFRLRARRGPKKAIVAVAASILTAAYHILRDGVPNRDLGPDHFDQIGKAKLIRRLVNKLDELGCKVEIKEAA